MSSSLVFIVGSGAGFFLEFINDTPHLTTDPVVATRMPLEQQAEDTIVELGRLGFVGELVEVCLVRRFECL